MRPTFLSEIENSLNPELRKIILQVRNRVEDEITIQHTASILQVSPRRIYQLCCSQNLDFVCFPHQKILKTSLIKYILFRHGIENIEVDDLSIHLDLPHNNFIK